MTTVKINYLGEIEIATGKAHDGYWGGKRLDGTMVAVRRVEPTALELDISPFTELSVGWGDREKSSADLAIWGGTADGNASYSLKHGLRIDGYFVKDSVLIPRIMEIHAKVVAAAQLAEETRPEVALVCASYRFLVTSMEEQYKQHYKKWDCDIQEIACKFRRKNVLVGEQTVPGKCCVRSVRGNLLGYANIRDGQWLGTVERIAA